MKIEKDELIQRLKIAEPYNNKDIPQYVWNIINGIPPAENIGKWNAKLIQSGADSIDQWAVKELTCQKCGKVYYIMVNELWDYCPHCGIHIIRKKQ